MSHLPDTSARHRSPPTPGPGRIEIVDAQAQHLFSLQAIYSHFVLNELCSFEEEAPTVAQMHERWQVVQGEGLPYLVALADGQPVGYAYAHSYRPRPAYRYTVENSIYVAPGLHGRGIGKSLLAALIDRCARCGRSQMVAVIGDSANAASIRLHEQAGFERVGVLRQVGFKFGRPVDTVLMQRALSDPVG